MKLKKRGGMWFWRVGRFGGTFYVTRKKLTWWQERLRRRLNTTLATVAMAAFCLYLKTFV